MNTTALASAVTTAPSGREPVKLLKRIGSTTFIVNVRFNSTSTETMEDKILRLMESEVRKSA